MCQWFCVWLRWSPCRFRRLTALPWSKPLSLIGFSMLVTVQGVLPPPREGARSKSPDQPRLNAGSRAGIQNMVLYVPEAAKEIEGILAPRPKPRGKSKGKTGDRGEGKRAGGKSTSKAARPGSPPDLHNNAVVRACRALSFGPQFLC
jgi:hypothetical protein